MALTKEEKWQRYLESAETIDAMIAGLKVTGRIDNPRHVNKVIGLIAEELHRVPTTPIGLISKKAAKLKRPPTPDHYFGRKVSADLIFKMNMRGCSLERIALLIWSRTRIIWVTSAENTLLKKFDGKNPHKTWSEVMREYSAANIQLIKHERKKKPHKYVYTIHGIVYTRDEACEKFNITPSRLTNNCIGADKKGRYTEWQRKENQ